MYFLKIFKDIQKLMLRFHLSSHAYIGHGGTKLTKISLIVITTK